jgi:hypothetical protein
MSDTSDEKDMVAEGVTCSSVIEERGDEQRCGRQVRLFGAGYTVL